MTVTGVCWAGPGAGMGPHCPRGGRIQETGGLPQAARSPAADSPRPGTLVRPGRLQAPCSSGTCPPPSPHAPARRRTCWSVLCGQVSFGLCVHRPPSTDRKCLAGTHLGGRWQRPSSQGTGSVTTDPITLSHTTWGPGRLLPPPTLKHAPGHADTLTSRRRPRPRSWRVQQDDTTGLPVPARATPLPAQVNALRPLRRQQQPFGAGGEPPSP